MDNSFDSLLNVSAVPQDDKVQAFIAESKNNRNRCYELSEQVTAQVATDGQMFQKYLDVQSTFDRYTANNALLILAQRPDAQRLGDYGYWRDHGTYVKRMERQNPILIMEPGKTYLGYDITVSRVQTLQKASNGRVQRCQTGVVKLYVPREKWVGKLIEYKAMKIKINENGKERFVALHRGKLVNQSDIEILARYNAEVRGLYNYYTIANDSFKIGRFANVMKYSMYKTFACKYKTNVHEIKRRYCRNELFTVAYETRQGMKTTTFYRDGYKRKECATKFDNVSELPQFSRYAKTNTLKQRVERHTCELCQKDCRNLVIHQVKKLKDLKGNTEWVLLMRKRRRKTLVVCPECHNLIHS